jgi:hypothetical protein
MSERMEDRQAAGDRKIDGIHILYDCKIAVLSACFAQQEVAAMEAIHTMLLRCKAEGIDPLSLFARDRP